MQIDFQKIKVISGDLCDFDAIPLPPFDDRICAFLNKLSGKLLKSQEAKRYPDVVTYAFFCRKSNLVKLKNAYREQIRYRLGRGITFHIAPGNVPINFAYTLTVALLAGNACVVKASSKEFPQTRIISDALNDLLAGKEFEILRSYIKIVVYPRENQEITDFFSSKCNIRIIWGGDRTIDNVRTGKIPPRSYDITFADRYSLCVMDAQRINAEQDLSGLAHDFYNDTYLYDQNACSSPRMIYWIGNRESGKRAQARFWAAVYEEIKNRYDTDAVIAVDKYMAFCRAAIDLGCVHLEKSPDNRIFRISLDNLTDTIPYYRCAGGSYLEYISEDLEDLKKIVNEKYQTVSYFGLNPEELRNRVIEYNLRGIDRIVPVGKAADFNLVWDGYDLILMMSRVVSLV